jgi:hypothetical protein
MIRENLRTNNESSELPGVIEIVVIVAAVVERVVVVVVVAAAAVVGRRCVVRVVGRRAKAAIDVAASSVDASKRVVAVKINVQKHDTTRIRFDYPGP